MANWSLSVSSEIDQRLRAFLGQKGVSEESLSRYVEEAVKQRLDFEETVAYVQERNLRYSQEEIETDIDEAIRKTRDASRS
ncbi:MAG: ribbon-helix-helix domain-containing protein [Crocosphaera sp.]|uniref:ribbon-helix-helix domain-containing protein n=1 Tax=Crocosphaera sp. TaxID=2729996 RepID=UPI003F242F33|nr:ribbon-helix-helix domain-containing protein [Crocosphaera sp.]MDJ0844680.1 ribbon-helix-helix domain-containing protein [Crocosphaera sp.]